MVLLDSILCNQSEKLNYIISLIIVKHFFTSIKKQIDASSLEKLCQRKKSYRAISVLSQLKF